LVSHARVYKLSHREGLPRQQERGLSHHLIKSIKFNLYFLIFLALIEHYKQICFENSEHEPCTVKFNPQKAYSILISNESETRIKRAENRKFVLWPIKKLFNKKL
jgi:hypothetical protein